VEKPGFLFLLCLFLHASSEASVARKLTPYSKLPQNVQTKYRQAATASFHYKLNPGIACTGTFISDKGHFLTALHCIAGCLAKHRAIDRTLAADEPVQTPSGRKLLTSLMTVNEDKLDEGIECPGVIGNKSVVAKVILTGGKGWLSPKESVTAFAKENPDDYEKLLSDGYEHGYDFAILQTELPETASCLKLAEAAPKVGEALHTISYACMSRANETYNGTTALFTTGERTKGFRGSDFYKKRGPAGLPFKPELVERKETFFSSLDIEKCGSGSGIFDSQFRLVGIATRVYKSSTLYEYGSVEAVDIKQAWRDLFSKASGSQMKEITTCTPRPLTKASRH
jgi:hypothetical protein